MDGITALRVDDEAEFERNVALARAQLGEDVFATAWAEGQALSLEQAIAEAMGDAAEW